MQVSLCCFGALFLKILIFLNDFFKLNFFIFSDFKLYYANSFGNAFIPEWRLVLDESFNNHVNAC